MLIAYDFFCGTFLTVHFSAFLALHTQKNGFDFGLVAFDVYRHDFPTMFVSQLSCGLITRWLISLGCTVARTDLKNIYFLPIWTPYILF